MEDEDRPERLGEGDLVGGLHRLVAPYQHPVAKKKCTDYLSLFSGDPFFERDSGDFRADGR
nr:hypothetical protein [Frankia sp. AgB32]